MIPYRTNSTRPTTPDASHNAMQRHHARLQRDTATVIPPDAVHPLPAAIGGQGGSGDGGPPGRAGGSAPRGEIIIYGARKIALELFGEVTDQARRRVYDLADHYLKRKEAAGFFKLKGALCLYLSVWRKFHGLD